jgi:tetratricopeptide (TPR) repeat protein
VSSFEAVCAGCGAISGPAVGVCPFCKTVMSSASPGPGNSETQTVYKYWQDGKLPLALSQTASLIKEKKELESDPIFLLTYAKILIESEGPSSLIRSTLARAQMLAPENDEILEYITLMDTIRYFKPGPDEAEAILEKLLLQSPKNAHVHFALGSHLYFTEKQYDRAIVHLEQCVQLRPSFSRAWGALGALYRETKKPDLAARAFQTCLKFETNPAMITFLKDQLATVVQAA